ncbi:hypothetical protein ACOAKC_05505 [Hathewaya histolytica]|uniref:hypothetical protein n=1 Tax=Hathewaya histolytica TaxID=1498 RepID=UPI003B66BEF8
MSKCPFLSNNIEDVNCFKECCFYKEPVAQKCPFKQSEEATNFEFKEIEEKYGLYSEENSLLDIIYDGKSIG